MGVSGGFAPTSDNPDDFERINFGRRLKFKSLLGDFVGVKSWAPPVWDVNDFVPW